MAKGNCILLTSPQRGGIIECIISGTPSPGTVMEKVPGVATVGGRHTMRASTRASGLAREIAVLLDDSLVGKGPTDAYTAGSHGRVYYPAPGDELNMLVDLPGTGTGSSATIGERLMVGSDGKLTPEVGSPQATPFVANEVLSDISGTLSQLCWVTFGPA